MKLIEGFIDDKTPDMKYYAFDWDDNIANMPTKIMVNSEDGEEIGMSTDDFATYRHKIGKEPFQYKDKTIIGFSNNPFRNFKEEGDAAFIIDSMIAKEGPAFKDLKEAINNGSIFSIITARGHNPETLKDAIRNYIMTGFGGIDKDQLVKNLKKYRDFVGEEDLTDNELIETYLDLNKYYPVTFGDEGGAVNPEEAKVSAMSNFIQYIKKVSSILNKKAFFKNEINNNFELEPIIGFSDDDLSNVETMYKSFKDEPDNLKIYSTSGGIKKPYN